MTTYFQWFKVGSDLVEGYCRDNLWDMTHRNAQLDHVPNTREQGQILQVPHDAEAHGMPNMYRLSHYRVCVEKSKRYYSFS